MGRKPENNDKIPEILRLLSLGKTEREICHSLEVSKGTVYRAKKGKNNVCISNPGQVGISD